MFGARPTSQRGDRVGKHFNIDPLSGSIVGDLNTQSTRPHQTTLLILPNPYLYELKQAQFA